MNTVSSQTKSKEDILSIAQNASETGIAKETTSVNKETDEMIKRQAQQIADLIAENDSMKAQLNQLVEKETAEAQKNNTRVDTEKISDKDDNYYETMSGKVNTLSASQVAERQSMSAKVSDIENRMDGLTLSSLISNDFNQNIKPVLGVIKNKIIDWGKEATTKFGELKTDISKTVRNVKQACRNYAAATKESSSASIENIFKPGQLSAFSKAPNKKEEIDKSYDAKIAELDTKIKSATEEMSKHTGVNKNLYANTLKSLENTKKQYVKDKDTYDKYADTIAKANTAAKNFGKSVATACKSAVTAVKEAPSKAAASIITKAAASMRKGLNWANDYLAKSDKTYTAKAETADKVKAEKTTAKVNTKENEGPEVAD